MKNIQTPTTIKELLEKFTLKKITVYNSIIPIAIVIVFSLLFYACQKESPSLVAASQSSNALHENVTESSVMSGLPTIPYVSCGMKMNVFTPFEHSANVYAFAYTINGQKKKFGISSGGQMNFNTYDKFSFEFAGYLDKSSTVKSWRIRRTDGKYLTAGMEYKDKLTGSAAAQQKFLLASLGNGQYKILLPKLPVCNIAAIWDDVDLGYRIYNFDYDDDNLNFKDTKVTMMVIPLPNG